MKSLESSPYSWLNARKKKNGSYIFGGFKPTQQKALDSI